MTPDEKKAMDELQRQVARLTQVTQELTYALTGSNAMGTKGVIQRLADNAHEVELQQRRSEEFREFMRKRLDEIEIHIDHKVDTLDKKVDEKLESLEEFREDVRLFQIRFETYAGIITSKSLWRFLVRVIVFTGIIVAALIAWYKGGWEFVVKFLKDIKLW